MTKGIKQTRLVELETHDVSIKSHLSGQLTRLSERGFDVHVIAADTGYLAEIEGRENVTVHAVPMSRDPSFFSDLRSLASLFRLLRRIRPDLINYGTPKASLLGALAAFAARVPVRVYTRHGLRQETMSGLPLRLFSMIERLIGSLSTLTVCVSPSLERRSAELGVLSPRHRVLGDGSANGININKYLQPTREPQLRRTVRAQHGWDDEDIVIGFVGRITRDKGIDELCAAFDQLSSASDRRWRLALAGGHEHLEGLSSRTRELLESHPDIVQLGQVKEPSQLYPAFDVFCLPSYREGLPTVLLEAGAANLPVVATRATGIVDVISDNETGLLVPVGAVDQLAVALGVMAQANIRASYANALHQHVCVTFADTVVWERWGDLFTELCPPNDVLNASNR